MIFDIFRRNKIYVLTIRKKDNVFTSLQLARIKVQAKTEALARDIHLSGWEVVDCYKESN